jgi:toxin secretion/phage lysis holin
MALEAALNCLKYLIALVGGLLTCLLGGWDVALEALVYFVVLDYLTGVMAAWITKTLNSNVGLRGIARKVFIFSVVAVAVYLDRIIGQNILRSVTIFFYIANEGLSILENLGRAGVAIPAPVLKALEQLKERSEGANNGS